MKIRNSKFEFYLERSRKIRNVIGLVVVLMFFLSSANLSLAHVVVKPSEVKSATFQTFTMGVPNEKDLPTVGLRLIIPEGLKHVSPNVKPGWTVEVKRSGEGEEATVTEISWTGGVIPVGQRDDFLFSAQAPAEAGSLNWKAYQTYRDGTIVSWDQDPNSPKPSESADHKEAMHTTPYSMTKVVNDLSVVEENTLTKPDVSTRKDSSMIFSIGALLLSFIALGLALRKR